MSAITRDIVYDPKTGDHDPNGLQYVLDGTNLATNPGPLFLRANAGDCVQVNLTNKIGTLSAVVATDSLVVMDTTSLLLSGNITSNSIRVGASGTLQTAPNITVTTGGSVVAQPQSHEPPTDSKVGSGFNLAITDGKSGLIFLGDGLDRKSTRLNSSH